MDDETKDGKKKVRAFVEKRYKIQVVIILIERQSTTIRLASLEDRL